MTVSGPSLRAAVRRLRAGEIIVHPTESVYGFGGILEDAPIRALRALKGRPKGGFVVLIPTVRTVQAILSDLGRTLAETFWPGPLTLVLDDPGDLFHRSAKADDGSVAVRVPGCDVALALLKKCGRPITSSSANAPGAAPATTAAKALAAARAKGMRLFALDAGSLTGGSTSTIVRLGSSEPVLIREGGIDVLDLNEITPVRFLQPATSPR